MVKSGEEVQGLGRHRQRKQGTALTVGDDMIRQTMADQERAMDERDFPETLEPLGREQSCREHGIAQLRHLCDRHERGQQRQTADRKLARHAGRHAGAERMAEQDEPLAGYPPRR